MMLTDPQVDAMRVALNESLWDTATIQSSASVSDGAGGRTETWADRLTVACRIAPVGGGETGTRGARIVDETTHVVTLPAGTLIEEADRLLVGGVTYEVTVVRKRGARELSRRAELKETP